MLDSSVLSHPWGAIPDPVIAGGEGKALHRAVLSPPTRHFITPRMPSTGSHLAAPRRDRGLWLIKTQQPSSAFENFSPKELPSDF